MRILVVGSGAMGSLLAALFALGGHRVWLLGRRREVVETINLDGLRVIEGESEKRTKVAACLDAAESFPVDLVVMAVKAYDTLQASKDALPAMTAATIALTLQNGLGNIEAMASVMGPDQVLGGVTSHGATLVGTGVARHAGSGDTVIGEVGGQVTDRVRAISGALQQAGVQTEITTELNSVLWRKVAVNSAINPLTALLRVPNGRLLEIPETKALMAEVCRETALIANSLGIDMPYADAVERVERVCRLTAPNRSSMLQDVERGARTEIDYINGAVVRAGERSGVPSPVNRTMADLVRAMHRSTG